MGGLLQGSAGHGHGRTRRQCLATFRSQPPAHGPNPRAVSRGRGGDGLRRAGHTMAGGRSGPNLCALSFSARAAESPTCFPPHAKSGESLHGGHAAVSLDTGQWPGGRGALPSSIQVRPARRHAGPDGRDRPGAVTGAVMGDSARRARPGAASESVATADAVTGFCDR